MGNWKYAASLINRLRAGRIYFVLGNHDKALRQLAKTDFNSYVNKPIEFLPDLSEINIGGQQIVLCHYAMRTWRKSHYGRYHLYGHSHGSLKDDIHSLSFDVGVDCHDYKPINMDRVIEIMSKKNWKAIDHHGS